MGILAALKFAPAIFSAATSIFSAVTGNEPKASTPEALAEEIVSLPESDRAAVTTQVLAFKAQIQALDTDRYKTLTEGDAAKVAATARPEIAKRAMGVLETFSLIAKILFAATALEWFVRAGYALAGATFPEVKSIWSLVASAQPIAEMIWAPLIASFWVCAGVIKKYMGCRERDKAQQYEMMAGRPLSSSAATVEAAGGAIAGLVNAWKGRG